MARAAEIYGLSAVVVDGLTGFSIDGLTATGSSQTDALALSTSVAQFTTVGASTGAILPVANSGDEVQVQNSGSNALSVYPPVGGKINNGTTNAAFSVTNGKGALFRALSALNYIAILSA